jgi:hypothetical protein
VKPDATIVIARWECRVPCAANGRFLGVLRLPRNDNTLCVAESEVFFCHPEPAKTARDLSRGDGFTRVIQCGVVNPDATILTTQLVCSCDLGSVGEIPQRLRCFGMTASRDCLSIRGSYRLAG